MENSTESVVVMVVVECTPPGVVAAVADTRRGSLEVACCIAVVVVGTALGSMMVGGIGVVGVVGAVGTPAVGRMVERAIAPSVCFATMLESSRVVLDGHLDCPSCCFAEVQATWSSPLPPLQDRYSVLKICWAVCCSRRHLVGTVVGWGIVVVATWWWLWRERGLGVFVLYIC